MLDFPAHLFTSSELLNEGSSVVEVANKDKDNTK